VFTRPSFSAQFAATGDVYYVLAFSPDSQILAAGTGGGTVRLFRPANWKQTSEATGHEDVVWNLAWDPLGTRLASASYDRTARIWDPNGGHLWTVSGHSAALYGVAFHPPEILRTIGRDGKIGTWDASTGALRNLLSARSEWGLDAAFSRDGLVVATAGEDRIVRIYQLAAVQAVRL
jgi:WD40 repeat protein